MKVVIIGASGQLGQDLVKEFGEEAVPLTHSEIEVTDYESVEKKLFDLKPNVVINTAAYVKVDDAEDEPEKAFAVNSIGALNVAKACEKINAVNVYISTDFVFDGTKKERYTEEDKVNPLNVYGLSKLAGEFFTKNYSSKYYVIRVASLYGNKGSANKGNFVMKIIDKVLKGEELKVINDLFMNPTYTSDVAKMIKKIIEKKLDYSVYHCVNEGACSWFEFAEKILELKKINAKINPVSFNEFKMKARRPVFSVLENNQLHQNGLRMRKWGEALQDYLKNFND